MKTFDPFASRLAGHGLLLLLVAALTCTNQLLLKSGITRGGPITFSVDGFAVLLARIFTTPAVLAGYAVGAVTGLVWLLALTRLEISLASPVVTGIYFVLLLLASRVFLNETVSFARWAGVSLIVVGIFLLTREG